MSVYEYAGSQPYPKGHPLHGAAEIQWFRRDLDVSEYRDRLAKAEEELNAARDAIMEAEDRYHKAQKALRDAIDDK